ncbi:MAG: Gfo/Idh/MocA family protein [Clostridiales bacterium]
MKIGVVGLGYWGPNLVRNFLLNEEIEKVYGCDKDKERLKYIRSKFQDVKLTSSYNALIDSSVEAIAIATPVHTHFRFAKQALEAGKHIWVEKPFTINPSQAEEIIRLSKKNNLKIFVDHTFIYTDAVRKIKQFVERDDLGDIIYFDSVRINLGLFQHDVNVIWDLVPHDLAIMNYLLKNKNAVAVSANGIANYYDQENIAHISIHFENKSCFAHFHVNWTSPVKIRKIIIAGTKKMLVYDDMENSEKIKVYDCGVEMLSSKEKIRKALVQYRIGDMYSPKVNQTEALSNAVKEFISAIKENRPPLTNGQDGLNVVRILVAANVSLKNNGHLVELPIDGKSEETYKDSDLIKNLGVINNGY